MLTRTIDEQLVKYLTDAHAIEQQALVQLRKAPEIAGSPEIAQAFRLHLAETEQHERTIGELLAGRGAEPSRLKDTVMKLGGAGFALFAQAQPDTPGKLVAHAYSYEHLELAAYELLARVAERAGDHEAVQVAQRIGEQERTMADRLTALFDVAADAALLDRQGPSGGGRVSSYLADAHAIEEQSIRLLKKAVQITGQSDLAHIYHEHLEQTANHRQLIERRLRALDDGPSRLKDAAMRLGALNWGAFFQAQPDTAGKLAAFAFAFEHLEIAGYMQLKRLARLAGDEATATLAERILVDERAAASKLDAAFDHAVEASLDALAVPRASGDANR